MTSAPYMRYDNKMATDKSERLHVTEVDIENIKDIMEHLSMTELDTMTAARKEDTYNRHQLRSLYLRTLSYIQEKLPEPFQNDLQQWCPYYETRLHNYIEDLQTTKCVVLFAGETGAGKSSLINLLLGWNIMPTSELQCTSTFVEISYGSSARVTAHYRDDSFGRSKNPICKVLDSSENVHTFLDEIHNYITEKDEDTGESRFEKVQVQWPIQMLKGGVTIVDSPGVGGGNGVSQTLSSYLEKAFGFIYVMDITTSVHRHRLGELLLKAIEANDGFDHATTLFVCNHLDKVPLVSDEKVEDFIRSRLGMVLPKVAKAKLYPISVKNSFQDLKYRQINQHHKLLLEGIRTFMPQTMKGKLRKYYRFLSNLLKRIIYTLRLSFNMNKETVEEIRQCYNEVENRITILQRNPKQQLDMIKREVSKSSYEGGQKILQYLALKHTRALLAGWTNADCPEKDRSWHNVLKNANVKIASRVAEVINSWEKDTQFVTSLDMSIVKQFKEQFKLFDNQLRELEGVLLHGDQARKFVMEVNGQGAQEKQREQEELVTSSKGGLLSIGMAIALSFSLNPKDQRVKELFKNRYGANPANAMEKATHMFLDMMDDLQVAGTMNKYFDRLLKRIDKVGSMVPDIVKADKNLLVQLSVQLQKGSIRLLKLPKMADICNSIQGKLDMFYVSRLVVTDFTLEQINRGVMVGSGSNAIVYKGTLRQDQVDKLVALKIPLSKLTTENVTDVLVEESMLRDLQHRNIVKYYGMCRTGTVSDIRLIFVMEYCPITLKKKCVDVEYSPSNLGSRPDSQKVLIRKITNYLIQICSGLQYLHNLFVVHRDLKPENVLLSVEDEVKIADLGLAKKVRDIVTCRVGTPVFMAPEVLLLNDKYDTKADIYSFSMIMWELWYGKELSVHARDHILGHFDDAIKSGWRPSLTSLHSPPTPWTELMKQCWHHDPNHRPSAVEVGNKLSRYNQELLD